MKIFSKLASAFALTLAMVASASAAPTFVGQWDLYNSTGPYWSTLTVPTYTAQEAAAVIFGGNASDYVISTVDSNAANINFSAWLDQIYVGVGLFAQDYRVDGGTLGVYDYVGDTSAWVRDNGFGGQYINYAFRIDQNDVPEPGVLALLGLGMLAFAASRARKQ